ncbi:MAG: LysR family transcriptional regulator [Francisellaceae bacterium]
MNKLPPLNSIVVFHTIAQSRSFAQAAEKLNVTAGAISQQIKKLEDFLGVILVDRRKSGIELTRSGKIYYDDIDQALMRLIRATEKLRPQSDQSIQIRLISTLALQWLIPCLSDFYIQHPDIKINIMTMPENDYENPSNADFNIVLAADKPAPHAQKLWQDELVLVYNPKFISAPTLSQSPAIVVNHPNRIGDWQDFCKSSNWQKPNKELLVTNTAQALQAVINGVGSFVTHLPFVIAQINAGTLSTAGDNITTKEAFYLIERYSHINAKTRQTVKTWLLDQADAYL